LSRPPPVRTTSGERVLDALVQSANSVAVESFLSHFQLGRRKKFRCQFLDREADGVRGRIGRIRWAAGSSAYGWGIAPIWLTIEDSSASVLQSKMAISQDSQVHQKGELVSDVATLHYKADIALSP
jgi:hypothetical protein